MGSQQSRQYKRRDGYYIKLSDERLVPIQNTHEDWFTVTPYVAEFYSTVSMLPLLITGLWWFTRYPVHSALAICAALASAASHAYPIKRLLTLDKACAMPLVLSVVPYFQWNLLLYYIVPPVVGAWDAASRKKLCPGLPHLHTIWHLAGTVGFWCILSGTITSQ
jgi:hypothetical protein